MPFTMIITAVKAEVQQMNIANFQFPDTRSLPGI